MLTLTTTRAPLGCSMTTSVFRVERPSRMHAAMGV